MRVLPQAGRAHRGLPRGTLAEAVESTHILLKRVGLECVTQHWASDRQLPQVVCSDGGGGMMTRGWGVGNVCVCVQEEERRV